jgi:hypothetical protein
MEMAMHHVYNIKTEDGLIMGVWNEKVSSSHLDYYVGPFESEDKAQKYADDYTKSWRLGYNGHGRAVKLNSSYYVACSRWTSCD